MTDAPRRHRARRRLRRRAAPTRHGTLSTRRPPRLFHRHRHRPEILRDEQVEDTPDWAMNRAKLQRFVARKK